MVEKESVMDKDQIIAAIKEKVELPKGVAEKAGKLLEGQSFVGKKDDIIKLLTEKLKIDEKKANEIYNAVAEVLAGGLFDKVKAIFGKK